MSEPVTKAEFEAVLTPISNQLGKIDKKMDKFIDEHSSLKERVVAVEKDAGVNSGRITKIEGKLDKVVWFIVAAVLGAVLNLVVNKGGQP